MWYLLGAPMKKEPSESYNHSFPMLQCSTPQLQMEHFACILITAAKPWGQLYINSKMGLRGQLPLLVDYVKGLKYT